LVKLIRMLQKVIEKLEKEIQWSLKLIF